MHVLVRLNIISKNGKAQESVVSAHRSVRADGWGDSLIINDEIMDRLALDAGIKKNEEYWYTVSDL